MHDHYLAAAVHINSCCTPVYLGMVSVPPDVVPDSGPRDLWAGSGEALSVSDVRLEPRLTSSSNSLGTPKSPRLRGRTPTPTWTEGTPSYTESTYSGDQGECVAVSHDSSVCSISPAHYFISLICQLSRPLPPKLETWMTQKLHWDVRRRRW